MSAHSVNAFLEAPSACLSQQWRDKICSQTSNASNSSLDTVQRTPRNRRLTPTSVRSLGSVSSNPLRVRSENTPPACISSRNVFHSADDASLFQSPIRPSKHSSHKSSWSNDIPLPRSRTASALVRETGPLEDVDLNSRQGTPGDDDDSEKENEEPQEPRLSFETTREEVLSVREHVGLSNGVPSKILTASSANPHPSRSFKRWISHLRPHALKHRKPQTLTTTSKRWPIDDSPSEQNLQNPENPMTRHSGHRKTNSRSSAGIVDAVKAVTMARTTSTPASRKSRRSNLFGRSSRSSKVSEDQARVSSDQSQKHTSPADDAALRRIVRRQQTLEELVNSEASYVADLKVLIHVSELDVCLVRYRLLTCPGLLYFVGISTEWLPTRINPDT